MTFKRPVFRSPFATTVGGKDCVMSRSSCHLSSEFAKDAFSKYKPDMMTEVSYTRSGELFESLAEAEVPSFHLQEKTTLNWSARQNAIVSNSASFGSNRDVELTRSKPQRIFPFYSPPLEVSVSCRG